MHSVFLCKAYIIKWDYRYSNAYRIHNNMIHYETLQKNYDVFIVIVYFLTLTQMLACVLSFEI